MNISSTSRFGICILVWGVLTAHFATNFLGIAPQSFFDNWQRNGQARVLGGILAQKLDIDIGKSYLAKVFYPPVPEDQNHDLFTAESTHQLFNEGNLGDDAKWQPYNKQYGLQSKFYGALHSSLDNKTYQALQWVAANIFALSLIAMFLVSRRIYGWAFAFLLVGCLALSPWVTAFARNLYWSPFLLLLPGIFSAHAYLTTSIEKRYLFYALIFVAMMLKCLSNYEYITTVTLLACSYPLLGPMFLKDTTSITPNIKQASVVFTLCVAAFFAALLVHADIRGDSISSGLADIYQEDIKRRTYGSATDYAHKETQESMAATPMDVIGIYIMEWPEKRRMLLPGKVFWLLLAVIPFLLLYRLYTRDPWAKRDIAVFLVFLSLPLSWFVFAKGHSYTQTHINFVLWYFGFIPALLYVSATSVRSILTIYPSKHPTRLSP